MNIDQLSELPTESVRAILDGLTALKLNPFFMALTAKLKSEAASASEILESGEFPVAMSDLQGILYFHQLIGENKGMKRISKLLDSLIAAVAEELKSREPKEQETNDNPA